jgi:hypothetical protein
MPKKAVPIKIVGLRYLLCGVVPTFLSFEKQNQKETPEDMILDVKTPMPVLNITFASFSETLLAGQIFYGMIYASNTGCRNLSGLTLLTSQPSVIFIGKAINSKQLQDDEGMVIFLPVLDSTPLNPKRRHQFAIVA